MTSRNFDDDRISGGGNRPQANTTPTTAPTTGNQDVTQQAIALLAQAIETEPQITEEVIEALNVLRLTDPVEYNSWANKVAETYTTAEFPLAASDLDQLILAIEGPAPELTGNPDAGQQNLAPLGLAGNFGLAPPPAPPGDEFEVPPDTRPPLLGNIGEDYSVTRSADEQGGGMIRPTDPKTVQVPGRYRHEDQYKFASMSPAQISKIQRDLEKAGLLEPGYARGFWDQATADAMSGAMGYANRSGVTWRKVVDDLKSVESAAQRKDFAKFIPPTKMMPDPASINQTIKSRFRQALGREPTPAELNSLARSMSGDFAAQQDQIVAEARRAFMQENLVDTELGFAAQTVLDKALGVLGGRTEATIENPVDTTQRTITQVDPVSRFQEEFDRRFGSEVQFIEAQEDNARNVQNVLASVGLTQRMIGP